MSSKFNCDASLPHSSWLFWSLELLLEQITVVHHAL